MNRLLVLLAGPDRVSWRRPVFGVLFLLILCLARHLGWIDGTEWIDGFQLLVAVVVAGEAIPAAARALPLPAGRRAGVSSTPEP